MVGFRIHYTVDIVIGIVMGHYFYMIVCNFNTKIDDFLKYWYWKGMDKVGGKKNISDNNLSNSFK